MNRDFRSKDHPEANGRRPVRGEQAWTLRFPLEDGTELRVHLGAKGRQSLQAMLSTEEADERAGTGGSN